MRYARREIEFKMAVAVGECGVGGGIDEGAGNWLVSEAVENDALDGIGGGGVLNGIQSLELRWVLRSRGHASADEAGKGCDSEDAGKFLRTHG